METKKFEKDNTESISEDETKDQYLEEEEIDMEVCNLK